VNWHEPTELQAACRLEAGESDTSWLWLPKPQAVEIFGGTRKHQLRLGRLSTERLPLPNHLQGFRLARHDNTNVKRWAEDVLVWAHDGVLRVRGCMPSGTFMEVSSHAVDRSALLRSNPFAGSGVADRACLDVPAHLRASAQALARRFFPLPRGWPQIDALLEHLRTLYEHDRDATIPPGCRDPIHHFLHQARGGPSYQFVTAAALALRSLG